MDDVAAYGVSSVWNISENKSPREIPRRMSIAETQEEIRTKLKFASTLQEIDETYKTDAEFIEALKKNLLKTEHIYVTKTNGEVIELPVGATVFDFALLEAPDLIDQLEGAFINGKFFGPTTELQNGDIIQIKTNIIIESDSDSPKRKIYINGQNS